LELFYEIIRNEGIFQEMKRILGEENYPSFGPQALQSTSVENIEFICKHFLDFIQLQAKQIVKPKLVLEMINSHLPTLVLKRMQGLDAIERYHENPKHVRYFKRLLRWMLVELKALNEKD